MPKTENEKKATTKIRVISEAEHVLNSYKLINLELSSLCGTLCMLRRRLSYDCGIYPGQAYEITNDADEEQVQEKQEIQCISRAIFEIEDLQRLIPELYSLILNEEHISQRKMLLSHIQVEKEKRYGLNP